MLGKKIQKMMYVLSPLVIMLLVTSCASNEMVYIADAERDYAERIVNTYSTIIHSGDQLYIYVSGLDLESTMPFNRETHESIAKAGLTHRVGTTNVPETFMINNDYAVNRYLVNEEGSIVFPVLGRLQVEGITQDSLERKIQQLLIEGGFLTDPVVTVSVMNFRVAVVGEVKKPRELQITGDRLTILEAMSMCGDLTQYGLRNNVIVIREVEGNLIIGEIDLTSKEMFNSPYYYLQSNDIVYVEPNEKRKKDSYRNKDFNRYVRLTRRVYNIVRKLDSRYDVLDY